MAKDTTPGSPSGDRSISPESTPPPGPHQPEEPQPPRLADRLFSRFTHEQLAYLFVLALYVAGMLLTALVIVEALTWGLLSSFGNIRMMGLVISFASAGLVASRIVAGRYGNQLAAHYLPRNLPHALAARNLMRAFDLTSSSELTAFVVLYKLRVYSTRTRLKADEARHLSCVLEPLFTRDMYLPMMRTYLIRAHRLWFDADEVNALIQAGQRRFQSLTPFGAAAPDLPPPDADPPGVSPARS